MNFIVLFALLLTFSIAQDTGSCSDENPCTWTFNQGVLTFSGTGKIEPEEYYYLNSWNSKGFSTTKVVITEGITEIASNAFYGFDKLVEVELPASLTSFSPESFKLCTSLKSITVAAGNTVYSSRDGVLIEKVDDENMLVFYPLGKEETIYTLPDDVTQIGAVFSYSKVDTLIIKTSITSFPQDSTSSVRNIIYFGNEDITTGYCSDIPQTIIVPDRSQNQVKFFCGEHVMKVAQNYIDLLQIKFSGDIGAENTNSDAPKYEMDVMSGHLKITGKGDMKECNSPENSPFYHFSYSILTIEISDEITSIEKYIFNNFGNLKTITLPESIAKIGDHAFENCASLESVKILSSLTSIGSNVFDGCYNLIYLIYKGNQMQTCSSTIADDVFVFVPEDFEGDFCGRTEKIKYDQNGKISKDCGNTADTVTCTIDVFNEKAIVEGQGETKDFNNYADDDEPAFSLFNLYPIITSVEIEDGITKIGQGLFESCSRLQSVKIPSGVTEIGENSFGFCESLSYVELSENLETIGAGSFSGCILKNIILPASLKIIGNSAFSQCPLKSIILPSNLQTIGESAFEGSNFISISIPASVTSIASNAFSNCFSLLTVYYYGDNEPTTCDDSAFEQTILSKIKLTVKPNYQGSDFCGIETMNKINLVSCGENTIEKGEDKFYCTCYKGASLKTDSQTICECPNNQVGEESSKECVDNYVECGEYTNEKDSTDATSCTCVAYADFVEGSDNKQCKCKKYAEQVTGENKCKCVENAKANGNECKCNEGYTSVEDGSDSYCVKTCKMEFANNKLTVSDCPVVATLFIKEEYKAATSIEIKAGVEIIDSNTFKDFTKLTTVIIGKDVKIIERYAFAGCTGQTQIKYEGNKLEDCEIGAISEQVRSVTVTENYKEKEFCNIQAIKDNAFTTSVLLMLMILFFLF